MISRRNRDEYHRWMITFGCCKSKKNGFPRRYCQNTIRYSYNIWWYYGNITRCWANITNYCRHITRCCRNITRYCQHISRYCHNIPKNNQGGFHSKYSFEVCSIQKPNLSVGSVIGEYPLCLSHPKTMVPFALCCEPNE